MRLVPFNTDEDRENKGLACNLQFHFPGGSTYSTTYYYLVGPGETWSEIHTRKWVDSCIEDVLDGITVDIEVD